MRVASRQVVDILSPVERDIDLIRELSIGSMVKVRERRLASVPHVAEDTGNGRVCHVGCVDEVPARAHHFGKALHICAACVASWEGDDIGLCGDAEDMISLPVISHRYDHAQSEKIQNSEDKQRHAANAVGHPGR